MLPSASLGAKGPDGRQPALYEPIHGSAPDIAGQGLRQSDRHIRVVRHVPALLVRAWQTMRPLLEKAVERVLAEGYRTGDIMQPA